MIRLVRPVQADSFRMESTANDLQNPNPVTGLGRHYTNTIGSLFHDDMMINLRHDDMIALQGSLRILRH